MPRVLKHSFLLFFIVSHIYILLSNIPLFIFINRTPAGTIYPLYHSNSFLDYNMYLSVITQSMHGSWLMRDAYTTEATNPSLFYLFFILVGKAAGIFHLWPPLAYHIARIIGLEAFILAIFIFTKKLLGKGSGLLAAVIAITGTISPAWIFNEPKAFVEYSPWWAGMEALKRLDLLPHYIASYAGLVLSSYLLMQFVSGARIYTLFLLIPLTMFTGLALPSALIPLIFGAGAAFGITFIPQFINRKKFTKTDIVKIGGVSLTILFALTILFFMGRERYNGYPWDWWFNWDLTHWKNNSTFDREVFLSFGILPILAFPAAVWALVRGTFALRFVTFWALIPFLFLPYANQLGFGTFRLLSTAPNVPLAILAAFTLTKIIKNKFISVAVILIFFVTTIPVTLSRLVNDAHAAQNLPLYPVLYVPTTQWDAIQFVKTHELQYARFMSDEYTASVLSAYVPVTSYIGSFYMTKNFFDKQTIVRNFYQGNMTSDQARDLLTANNINFVYFGPNEKAIGDQPTRYPFLLPVYSKDGVTIYKVK